MVRAMRLMSGWPLILMAAALLMSGCTMTATMYADPQIQPYLRSLSRQSSYPLAQELTWKFHYTVGAGKHQQSWFAVDGELIKDPEAIAGVQLYASQRATAGMDRRELYSQMAREAGAQGRHADAQIYHGMSTVSVQTQIASERVALGASLGGAIQNLGSALLDAFIVTGAHAVAEYIKEESRAIIGERAPDGTVLELFFRAHKADGEEAEPMDVRMEWEAVATLKDADGKLWRSSASYMGYFLFALGSEPKPTPPEFNQSRYVQMDYATLLPLDSPDTYASEQREMARIAAAGGYRDLAVVAMSALEGLYQQMDAARAARGRQGDSRPEWSKVRSGASRAAAGRLRPRIAGAVEVSMQECCAPFRSFGAVRAILAGMGASSRPQNEGDE